MSVRRQEAFEKAKILLARGLPSTYVAKEVGVHHNTVMRWSQAVGYSLRSADRHGSRRLTVVLKGFLRLSAGDREVFLRAVEAVKDRR